MAILTEVKGIIRSYITLELKYSDADPISVDMYENKIYVITYIENGDLVSVTGKLTNINSQATRSIEQCNASTILTFDYSVGFASRVATVDIKNIRAVAAFVPVEVIPTETNVNYIEE